MKTFFALLLVIALVSCQLHDSTIKPKSFLAGKSLDKSYKTITLPAVNVEKELIEEKKEVGLAPRFGVPIKVKYTLNDATMSIIEGGALWRIAFKSAGAYFTMIHFSNFKLAKGATMHVIEAKTREFLGAFTSRNNKDDGDFTIGPIHGDQFMIELYEPFDQMGTSIMDIDTIAHAYHDLFNLDGKKNGRSGRCNINVACKDGDAWRDQIRGVGMLLRSSGARFCSGSLINNADNKNDPLFLSANHCGTSSSGFVVMFNYNADSCTSRTSRNTRDTVSGATSLSNGRASDFHIMRLKESPAKYKVFLNGWSRSNTPSKTVVGIHHPSGDNKKISFAGAVISYGYQSRGDTHWRVPKWNKGTTEGGSSGSPLFDSNKRIIGQLHGGTASCRNTGGWDGYGKIWKSWTAGLSKHLDPSGKNPTTVNGRNLE